MAYRITVVWNLLVLTVLVCVTAAEFYDGRQLCSHCQEVDNVTECTRYMWCDTDEKCMTSLYLTLDGHTKHYTGCATKGDCNTLEHHGTTIQLDGLSTPPQMVFNQSCCDGHGCNGIRNAPHGRSVCMSCDNSSNVTDCDTAILCQENHECLYHERLEITDSYEPIYKYNLRCGDGHSCRLLNASASCHHTQTTSDCSGDYGCCSGDFCNVFHAMYTRNITSSLLVAGDVHVQAYTGTSKAPTTASTSLTTPTASAGIQCYTGQDNDGVQYCTGDTPYCLNNLTNYINGHREVSKGCASEGDCKKLLAIRHSYCVLYADEVLYEREFACSYCCTRDMCNGRIVPPQETMYIPFSSVPAPIVFRNDPAHDCRDAMSKEQCLQFQCDNEHLARIYCRAHCHLCREVSNGTITSRYI